MKTLTAPTVILATLLVGCTASRFASTAAVGTPTVHCSLSGMSEGSGNIHTDWPVRISVDGVYVGDCLPEGQAVLQLPTGRHKVSVEIQRAWEKSGNWTWEVSVSGREIIVVLGGESTQKLVFAKHHLKKRRNDDE